MSRTHLLKVRIGNISNLYLEVPDKDGKLPSEKVSETSNKIADEQDEIKKKLLPKKDDIPWWAKPSGAE